MKKYLIKKIGAKMMVIKEIGIIKSKYNKPCDPFEMKKSESLLIIDEELNDGLYKIENSQYLDVFYYFHLSKNYDLITKNYFGDKKGVFATCSPHRPGLIGMCTVELLERNKNKLKVKGLDAVNNTPLLDIKPYFI